jgi:hypothetical protein
MKKTLLILGLAMASISAYAQDPVIQNATLDKIGRDGGSDCSCAGWQNNDLGDQLESSSWNSDSSFGAKFDDTESDIMYQEIAVLENTDYTFTYTYNFEDKSTDDLASSLDVRILAGSGYIADYTPGYPTPAAAGSTGYGYTDISVVENASNNLASVVVTPSGDKDFRTATLKFNSGSNTSVAIFARGIGRNVTGSDGKGYAWSNGSSEIRIDEVGITKDEVVVDIVIQNATLDKIGRDGGSDCSCAGWQNKDLGDQLESSSWNSDTSFGAKFDDTESDIMYQEVAVTAGKDYTFTYTYNFEDKSSDDLASSLDVRILAGSGYITDYTPGYPTAAAAGSTGYGYTDIAVVENASNNLASVVVTPSGDKDFRTATLAFNSGSNTSIAIFARGIGRNVTGSDGKGYAWSNGSSEIRIDEVSLVEGVVASVNDVFSSTLSIYPNPAKEFVKISTSEIITGVEVYSLIGKRVISLSNLKNNRLDVSNLSKGIYVLKVMSNDLVGSRKIIIE